MIEVVSSPPDLASWDCDTQPFYLEVFGETTPLVDRAHAEVLPAATDRNDPALAQPGPIYQYWWTIGHSAKDEQVAHTWSKLQDDVAARVYFFFPRIGGWRIAELAATVNYLHPFREHESLWNHLADDWKNLVAPTIADASSLAGAVPNPAFAGASALLGTIAKLQINSVPQVADFAWSVGKITMKHAPYGVMQGIMWTLPKRMFTDLGSRLTGSVALSFVPAHLQQSDTVDPARDPTLAPLPVLAHAVVYQPHGHAGDIWAPAKNDFIALQLAPRLDRA
ncbi:MAG: hypothetical protein ACRDHP_05785 [Ktedonobacterales bacterium]